MHTLGARTLLTLTQGRQTWEPLTHEQWNSLTRLVSEIADIAFAIVAVGMICTCAYLVAHYWQLILWSLRTGHWRRWYPRLRDLPAEPELTRWNTAHGTYRSRNTRRPGWLGAPQLRWRVNQRATYRDSTTALVPTVTPAPRPPATTNRPGRHRLERNRNA